jgi:hypothetical protein
MYFIFQEEVISGKDDKYPMEKDLNSRYTLLTDKNKGRSKQK